MQAAGGIEDDYVVAVVLGVLDSGFGDFNGVFGAHFKHGHARLFADDLQLVDSRGTVDVAGYEHRTAVLLFFEHFGELCGVGGFT